MASYLSADTLVLNQYQVTNPFIINTTGFTNPYEDTAQAIINTVNNNQLNLKIIGDVPNSFLTVIGLRSGGPALQTALNNACSQIQYLEIGDGVNTYTLFASSLGVLDQLIVPLPSFTNLKTLIIHNQVSMDYGCFGIAQLNNGAGRGSFAYSLFPDLNNLVIGGQCINSSGGINCQFGAFGSQNPISQGMPSLKNLVLLSTSSFLTNAFTNTVIGSTSSVTKFLAIGKNSQHPTFTNGTLSNHFSPQTNISTKFQNFIASTISGDTISAPANHNFANGSYGDVDILPIMYLPEDTLVLNKYQISNPYIIDASKLITGANSDEKFANAIVTAVNNNNFNIKILVSISDTFYLLPSNNPNLFNSFNTSITQVQSLEFGDGNISITIGMNAFFYVPNFGIPVFSSLKTFIIHNNVTLKDFCFTAQSQTIANRFPNLKTFIIGGKSSSKVGGVIAGDVNTNIPQTMPILQNFVLLSTGTFGGQTFSVLQIGSSNIITKFLAIGKNNQHVTFANGISANFSGQTNVSTKFQNFIASTMSGDTLSTPASHDFSNGSYGDAGIIPISYLPEDTLILSKYSSSTNQATLTNSSTLAQDIITAVNNNQFNIKILTNVPPTSQFFINSTLASALSKVQYLEFGDSLTPYSIGLDAFDFIFNSDNPYPTATPYSFSNLKTLIIHNQVTMDCACFGVGGTINLNTRNYIPFPNLNTLVIGGQCVNTNTANPFGVQNYQFGANNFNNIINQTLSFPSLKNFILLSTSSFINNTFTNSTLGSSSAITNFLAIGKNSQHTIFTNNTLSSQFSSQTNVSSKFQNFIASTISGDTISSPANHDFANGSYGDLSLISGMIDYIAFDIFILNNFHTIINPFTIDQSFITNSGGLAQAIITAVNNNQFNLNILADIPSFFVLNNQSVTVGGVTLLTALAKIQYLEIGNGTNTYTLNQLAFGITRCFSFSCTPPNFSFINLKTLIIHNNVTLSNFCFGVWENQNPFQNTYSIFPSLNYLIIGGQCTSNYQFGAQSNTPSVGNTITQNVPSLQFLILLSTSSFIDNTFTNLIFGSSETITHFLAIGLNGQNPTFSNNTLSSHFSPQTNVNLGFQNFINSTLTGNILSSPANHNFNFGAYSNSDTTYFIVPNQIFKINSNASIGTNVGTIQGFNLFSLATNFTDLSNPQQSYFNISPTGIITTNSLINTLSSITIPIAICDPNSICKQHSITINITNTPPSIDSDQIFYITKDMEPGVTIGIISGYDPEGGTLSFTDITQPSQNNFTITHSGSIIVKQSLSEFISPQILTIQACDIINQCTTQTITIKSASLSIAPNQTFTTYNQNGSFGRIAYDNPARENVIFTLMNNTSNFSLSQDGILSINAANKPAPDSYTLNITANTVSTSITVTVLNQAPLIQSQEFKIDTSFKQNDIVGTLFISDPDGTAITNVVVATNSSTKGNNFTVNNNQLIVSSATLTAEDPVTLTIKATDTNGGIGTGPVIIHIKNNLAPTISTNQIFYVTKDAAIGSVFGYVSAHDPEGQSITFSDKTSPTQTYFTVESSGALMVLKTLDANTPKTLTIQACDPSNPNAQCVTADISISLIAFGIVPDQTFTITTKNTSIGSVAYSNPSGKTVAFNTSLTVTPNTFQSSFKISIDGALSIDTTKPQPTPGIYTLNVTANDVPITTNGVTAPVKVIIINQAPQVANQEFTISTTFGQGKTIGSLFATDPDGDPFTLSISPTNPNFTILPGTNFLQTTSSAILTPTTPGNPISLIIQATDSFGAISTPPATININITNNPPPSIDPVVNSKQTFYAQKDAPIGSIIGYIGAYDPNGDNLTFSDISTTKQTYFVIQKSGAIMVQNSINTSTPQTITVQVCDPANQCAQSDITVNIITFSIIPNQHFTITTQNTSIGSVAYNNPSGGVVTFTSVTSVPPNNFTIDPNGALFSNNVPPGDYTLSITANGTTQSVFVTVVNHAPQIFDQEFTIATTFGQNKTIGTIFVSDPDGDNFTLSINPSSSNFIIQGNTLKTSTTAALTPGDIILTMQATDSFTTSTAKVTIHIVNNTVPVIDPGQIFYVAKDLAINSVIGYISAHDPQGAVVHFTDVSQPSQNYFTITKAGALIIQNTLDVNTPTTLTIQACDPEKQCTTQNITINTITFSIIPDQVFTITAQSASIGSIAYNNPSGVPVVFTAISSNNFLVSPNGALSINPQNVPTSGAYNFNVTANGLTTSIEVVILGQGLSIADQTFVVPLTIQANAVFGKVLVNNPENISPLFFTISDTTIFSVNSNNGAVSISDITAFKSANIHTFTASVSDGNNTKSAHMTVTSQIPTPKNTILYIILGIVGVIAVIGLILGLKMLLSKPKPTPSISTPPPKIESPSNNVLEF